MKFKLKFWEKEKEPQKRPPLRRRGYHVGGRVSYLPKWLTSPTKPNEDIKQSLHVMQARCRESLQNNPYIKRALSLVYANVVGPNGPVLQSKAVNGKGKDYKPARTAIENAWRRWGKKGSPDATHTKTWNGMLQEFWRQLFIDGEYLAIESLTAENPYGLKLQVIDPMLLDNDHEMDFKDGRFIKQGIEYNQAGRPLAYYILDEDPQQQYYAKGKSHKRIPASRVHHCFLPNFVNQRRGVPLVITILQRLVMMGKYEEAELVAALIGSSTMGIWEDNAENVGYEGTGEDDEGYNFEVEPGMFAKAPHGTKLNVFDPQHPNAAYEVFLKILLREVASGLDLSYATLANDYSDANYSSLRQAQLTDQEIWKIMQNFMIENFVEQVFSSFIENALVLQSISIGNRPLANDFMRFSEHRWRPKRWGWVDPKKEMDAIDIGLRNRIISPQQVILEKGDDPQEVIEQWEEWLELTKNLPEPAPAGFLTPGESDEEESDSED